MSKLIVGEQIIVQTLCCKNSKRQENRTPPSDLVAVCRQKPKRGPQISAAMSSGQPSPAQAIDFLTLSQSLKAYTLNQDLCHVIP